MIFFSKLVTIFLLPPGCFFLGLFLLIFFVPRKIKYFLGLITLFLYLLSIRPVSDFLLRPLEDAYPPLSIEDIVIINDPPSSEDAANSQDAEEEEALAEIEYWPQAIVVLGGGTIQNSPEAGAGRDTLASDALKRAVYAFTLRDDFPVPFIFSGGKVFEYSQEPEAVVAGRLFESLGLPLERFIAEPNSRNTWENAKETAKLEIERAVLVTSAYHIKRGVYCFERNGISVVPAPTDYKCDRGRKYDIFSFLPSMDSLRYTWIALHEYIGLVYYIIAYR